MKTTFDIVDELYTLVSTYSLGTSIDAPSGGFYKFQRPDNSTKEDVVINCLPITSETVQYCTANVNVHVPDKAYNIGGKVQHKPDNVRLAELAAAYSFYMEYLMLTSTGYEVTVESQSLIQEPEIKQHYVNIRLRIRVFNN